MNLVILVKFNRPNQTPFSLVTSQRKFDFFGFWKVRKLFVSRSTSEIVNHWNVSAVKMMLSQRNVKNGEKKNPFFLFSSERKKENGNFCVEWWLCAASSSSNIVNQIEWFKSVTGCIKDWGKFNLIWRFEFRLESIFVTAPAASKNV